MGKCHGGMPGCGGKSRNKDSYCLPCRPLTSMLSPKVVFKSILMALNSATMHWKFTIQLCWLPSKVQVTSKMVLDSVLVTSSPYRESSSKVCWSSTSGTAMFPLKSLWSGPPRVIHLHKVRCGKVPLVTRCLTHSTRSVSRSSSPSSSSWKRPTWLSSQQAELHRQRAPDGRRVHRLHDRAGQPGCSRFQSQASVSWGPAFCSTRTAHHNPSFLIIIWRFSPIVIQGLPRLWFVWFEWVMKKWVALTN